jgi:hypothetical protein
MSESPSGKTARDTSLNLVDISRQRFRRTFLSSIFERLLRWLAFVVIFSTMPLVFAALSSATQKNSISFADLVGHGELLLLSVMIAASSAGELFATYSREFRTTRLILIAMSFLIMCLSSLWYADVWNATRNNIPLNDSAVVGGSLTIYLCSVITGGCCIAISAVKR